ncbi:MAG: LacI family DNA-binding transcriptional regulator [Caldilineaceae bacterium]
MTRKTNATIHEIARHAGVGVGTVSRVLNDSPNVSPTTRELVLKVIAERGYRPKTAAKVLRTSKTHVIGFVTDEIATTPFAGNVIRGAQDAAWAQGKILLLVNTNRNSDILETAIEMLLDRQVEGMIYATMFHQSVQLPASIHTLPTVLVDCFTEDRSLPSVVPDEGLGGYIATEQLLRKGHRRIGFINDIDLIPARFGRLEGYRQALASYHLPIDEALICYETPEPHGGYAGALALLRLPDPPTAIFCFNDRMAMGAYEAIRERNLAIPHDVAVIGFDNMEVIAGSLRPPLTTMALPHYEMGQWAVNYLIEQASAVATEPPRQVKMTCPLITRASI